jgi:hypothetical protein
VHRFANTSDVVATIGHILGLEALSNLDRFGRPLTDVFAASPDTTPYTALVPAQRRDEVNQDSTGVAILNRQLDLSREDPANEALFQTASSGGC